MLLPLLACMTIAQFEPPFAARFDLERHELAGPVRQSTTWHQDDLFSKVRLPIERTQRKLLSIVTFSDEGLALEERRFDLRTEELNFRQAWRHDSHGNLTEWMTYQGNNEQPANRLIILYDLPEGAPHRKAIGERSEDAEGNVLRHYRYEFDEQGRKSAVILSNPDGSFYSGSRYEYSEDGRAITIRPFEEDEIAVDTVGEEGYRTRVTNVFHLDENGALARRDQLAFQPSPRGITQTETTFYYNRQGRATHWISHGQGSSTRHNVEYTDDEHGNWVEKRYYSSWPQQEEEANLYRVEIREIEYY